MVARRWFSSTYRIEPTEGGRFFGIIHHVRFDKKKGQVGGYWYYSPAYPDRDTARKNIRYALKSLDKGFNTDGMLKRFNGDMSILSPDAWVWRPLV